MREPGFDEFADLWNEPGASDEEAFEQLARKARRQGRLGAYVDLAFVSIFVVGAALSTVMTPHPATIVAALCLLVITSILSWKRRQLRQMAKTLVAGDRMEFFAASVGIEKVNLRRNTLGLIFLPPGVAAAVAFKVALRNNGHLEHPLQAFGMWAASPRGMISLTLMVLFLAWMIASRRKTQLSLDRLKALRSDFLEEDEITSAPDR